MNKTRKLIFLFLAVCWMVVIFLFSARNAQESTEDSYAVGMTVGKITQPSFEQWSQEEQLVYAEKVDFPVRKIAHATEYALLSCLLLGVWYDKHKKLRRYVWIPWLIATLYAVTDEVHQWYVPGRSCQATDVMIDSVGAMVGILFSVLGIYFIHKIKK